jgi:AcrR family transcriptional regulator
METRDKRAERRKDALTKERIVQTAIEILDAGGDEALTFRALSTRLATGPGALYHHVENKNELLAAATHHVIARVVADVAADAAPREAIRTISLGVFDAIVAHPWVGTQLSLALWRSAVPQFFEGIGRQLLALKVPEPALFDSASAFVNYVLGCAGQHAANLRLAGDANITDRAAFLGAVSDWWTQLDPAHYPFVHLVQAQMRAHDDRAQFLAGIELILDGLETGR